MFSFSCCHLNQELQDKSTKNLPKHIQKYFYIKYIIFKNIILICNYISKIYNFIKVEVSFYKEKSKDPKVFRHVDWKLEKHMSKFKLQSSCRPRGRSPSTQRIKITFRPLCTLQRVRSFYVSPLVTSTATHLLALDASRDD